MKIYVFKSEANAGLYAFAGEICAMVFGGRHRAWHRAAAQFFRARFRNFLKNRRAWTLAQIRVPSA
jgi:hypothetical protein